MARSIKRGDIFHIDLDPIKGREQAGKRYVMVVSHSAFNTATGVPLICPITQGGGFARGQGFTVPLAGTDTQGVVLCHQPRVMDFAARGAKYKESAPDFIIDEVLAKVATLLE